MATTQDHPDVHHPLATAIGVVDVYVQSGRTVLVRGGLDESGMTAEASRPLQLGRGVEVSARMHFIQRDGRWKLPTYARPFLYRLDQRRDKDVTSAQIKRAVDAILPALEEWASTPEGHAVFQMAQLEVSQAEACERTALALQLRRIADHLDEEAHELLNGGVMQHRRATISPSVPKGEKLKQVMRRDGTLMVPCPQPPAVYGSLDVNPARIIHNEEES